MASSLEHDLSGRLHSTAGAAPHRAVGRLYRLVDLQGAPHPELDLPYDSLESAQAAASAWCERINRAHPCCQAVGVEVSTPHGAWRTLHYVAYP